MEGEEKWDAQGCRLGGYGRRAAGDFNTCKNYKLVVVSTACSVCERIGYDAAVSAHVAVKLGEAPQALFILLLHMCVFYRILKSLRT